MVSNVFKRKASKGCPETVEGEAGVLLCAVVIQGLSLFHLFWLSIKFYHQDLCLLLLSDTIKESLGGIWNTLNRKMESKITICYRQEEDCWGKKIIFFSFQ